MKKLLRSIALLLYVGTMSAQYHCAKMRQASSFPAPAMAKSTAAAAIHHENKYDVRFVHLDLQLERTNADVKGSAKTVATVTAAVMDTFMTLLHQNHTVDSIRFNGALLPHVTQDSMIKVTPPTPLTTGSSFTAVVYYHGTAPTGGSAIGSGYNHDPTGWYGNAASWSLSQALVAYHWWPCKQHLTDKIDSSWVFITTDATNLAGSNGRLTNVVTLGSKKRHEWKSRAPIDYYLISVAVAEYTEYIQYAHPTYLNDSILIQNYIYTSAWTNGGWQSYDKLELDKLPATMELLCDLYGMYPFYKEKYGNCMGSMGGGMEHQTMSTQGFFDFYVDAHELGHQWWGDNVTCKTWRDIWINEGFATYTEVLAAEYLDPLSLAGYVTQGHNFIMGQNGGSVYVPPADSMNTPRIFDNRLTYAKGGAIIHTLRFVTNNDSTWFNTLRGFQNTYKHSVASVTDFMNYYQAQTGINPTQFFNQWYYGEGYPLFKVKYNQVNGACWINSTQVPSMPSVTPLFMTPLEYAIKRTGYADTIVRVQQNNVSDTYSFAVAGHVTNIVCDPHNWIINKAQGSIKDTTLGVLVGLKEVAGTLPLTVGPNPTTGRVELVNNLGLKGNVTLYDLTGRLVQETNLETKNYFDLGNYPTGIYLLKVKTGGAEETYRIIRN